MALASGYQRTTQPTQTTSPKAPCGCGSSKSCSCNTCPTCAGLECLCRPRFFAGQLLTESNLNQLEKYVIDKNKLHNRYLNGWGVVCGLEVLCSPCQGTVTVKPGYALSPCGDDIIVCSPTTVNICDLLAQCTRPTLPNCDPPTFQNYADCKDVPQQWLLTLKYHETSARGITSLRGQTSHSSGCGCGCGGKSTVNPPSKNSVGNCEPTQICEGFVFELCKAPAPKSSLHQYPGNAVGGIDCPNTLGPLGRACACMTEYVQSLPPYPGAVATANMIYTWICEFRQALWDFSLTHDAVDCSIFDKLRALLLPDPGQKTTQEYLTEVGPIIQGLHHYGAGIFKKCLCAALLPPCPDTVCDPRVILATVTVQGTGSDCKVLEVCNLSHRNFAVTLPSLEYWLSDLFPPAWNRTLERLCCTPMSEPGNGYEPGGYLPRPDFAARATGQSETKSLAASYTQDFSTMLLHAITSPDRGATAERIFGELLGFPSSDGKPEPPVTGPLGMTHPLEYLFVQQVLAPTLESIAPSASTLSNFQAPPMAPTRTEAIRDLELTQVQSQVTELQNTVRRQEEMIANLMSLVKSQGTE